MRESGFTPREAIESEPTPPVFDAIIVLGCGVEKTEGEIDLGLDGTWRTIAAANLYQQGRTKNIILTGGQTAGPDMPSEAQAMAHYLTRNFTQEEGQLQRIPEDAIHLEEYARDTSTNLAYVKELIEEEGWKHIGIVTNSYHLPRATQLAKNLGISAAPISAEEEIIKWDPRFREMANRYYTSEDMKRITASEQKLAWLLKVDPKGKIPQLITKYSRG